MRFARLSRPLDATERIQVVAVSTFRETDPVDYLDQPRFLNGAAALDTTLAPRELLDALLEVERSLGRTREGPRFGPRTIDLDLLLYGDESFDEPGLTVPHPRLHVRAVRPRAAGRARRRPRRPRARAAGDLLRKLD